MSVLSTARTGALGPFFSFRDSSFVLKTVFVYPILLQVSDLLSQPLLHFSVGRGIQPL